MHRLRRGRWSWPVTFALAAAGFFLLLAGWSLATPPWGAPDEPAHVLRAVGAARGQIYLAPAPAQKGTGGYVTVPRGLGPSAQHPCFAFHEDRPATCGSLVPRRHVGRTVRRGTAAGRYFPTYYLPVGLPSLFAPDVTGLRLMRLVSCLLSALALAAALTLLRRWRDPLWGTLALVLTCTPMTLFMASVVNPSGFEITTAVTVWVALVTALVLGRVDRRLVLVAGVAAVALTTTRALSPLWLLLTVLVALSAAWSRSGLVRVLRRRDAAAAAAATVVATVAALVWTVADKTLQVFALHPNPANTFSAAFAHAWGKLGYRTTQMVGILGWLDTRLPAWVLDLWWAVTAALAAAALALGRWRRAVVLVALGGLVVFVPLLLEAHDARNVGFVWQGRYTLPLAVGIPVLAAAVVQRRLVRRAATGAVVLCLSAAVLAAQLGALWRLLQRFTHGVGPLAPVAGPTWSPPGGVELVLALAVSGSVLVLGAGMHAWWARRAPGPPAAAEAAPAPPPAPGSGPPAG